MYEKQYVIFNNKLLKEEKNLFAKLIPQSAAYKDVIGVYDTSNTNLKLMSDVLSQKIICFSGKKAGEKSDIQKA